MKKFPLYFAIIFIIYLVIILVITTFIILPSYQKSDKQENTIFITTNIMVSTSAVLIISWILAMVVF